MAARSLLGVLSMRGLLSGAVFRRRAAAYFSWLALWRARRPHRVVFCARKRG
jgi:hypothetical protein